MGRVALEILEQSFYTSSTSYLHGRHGAPGPIRHRSHYRTKVGMAPNSEQRIIGPNVPADDQLESYDAMLDAELVAALDYRREVLCLVLEETAAELRRNPNASSNAPLQSVYLSLLHLARESGFDYTAQDSRS